MRKSLYLLLLFFLAPLSFSLAQSCMGVELKTGQGFEMKTFNGKGKEEGTIVYKILSVEEKSGKTEISLEFESFNTKGKSEMKNSYKMVCDGNTMTIDAGSMINQDQLKSLENFQMKFTSTDIVYPSKLTVGQTLPDASMKGEGSSGPLPVTFNMTIEDRKVTAKETITVGAGTFDTFKVNSNMVMETKMGMGLKLDMQSISYRSPDMLWDIRTESYRNGKLISRTELSRVF
ncbi:TapB family protein [Dyadobacter tibetensis]|uniref:TapB family protein n=1 Tax=Dyadobacter tibetensis TaxID=1211851 RepID=UPI0004707B9B|nr:hypothetical protein [Dyadobacter tibetensis]